MKILSFHIIYAGENVGFCQVLPARGCQMQQMQHIKKGEIHQIPHLKKRPSSSSSSPKKGKGWGFVIFKAFANYSKSSAVIFNRKNEGRSQMMQCRAHITRCFERTCPLKTSGDMCSAKIFNVLF